MCNRILGMAVLMVRQTVRSRFVACLLGLMLFVLLGFALTIKGDGTAAGRLQMLLSYGMSAVGAVLGMATLWLACGSFASEIEDRRLHLVVVKPVRNVELWIGKWLGILTVDMLMLVVAGMFLFAAGHVALWRTMPDTPDGRAVRQQVLVARSRINVARVPGTTGSAEWQFDGTAAHGDAQAVATLEYRFVSPMRDLSPVPVRWELVGPDGKVRFHADREANRDGVNRLEIPLGRLPAEGRATFVFRIRSDRDGAPAHVTFHPQRPVVLLVPTGGFGLNLVRSLLLMFCRVALLAALGVTFSTLFTFPVAVFVSAALVVATLATRFFVFASEPAGMAGHHDDLVSPQWVEWVGSHLAHGMQCVVGPALRYRVAGRLAGGVSVPWSEVCDAAGILVFVYGGVLCVLACATLRRREIALPV